LPTSAQLHHNSVGAHTQYTPRFAEDDASYRAEVEARREKAAAAATMDLENIIDKEGTI
jgi:hypothetical protein